MIKLQGKYSEGIVYSDQYEESGIKQIQDLLDEPFSQNSNPRFMPDYHAGLGSVIGTTMIVKDEICPNLVGVDIGCGIRTEIFETPYELDFKALDDYIRNNIPSGFKVHNKERPMNFIDRLYMRNQIKDQSRLKKSMGTLGGGNHYIEIGKGERENEYILTVHSGSRNLGLQVANYYQKIASSLSQDGVTTKSEEIIKSLKEQGREKEIAIELKKIQENPNTSRGLETLKSNGKWFFEYLHDMNVCVEFALENRNVMAEKILDFLKPKIIKGFDTVHNYNELNEENHHILRKGAVAAYKGQLLTIPMNMRDGILICEGLGNPQWNYSAPHGAGRLMSRNQAKTDIALEDYEESMRGIFTTSVNKDTIDEAPFAYKPMKDIINYTKDTVKILQHVKPMYNFKSK